jgi:hypothetical protein
MIQNDEMFAETTCSYDRKLFLGKLDNTLHELRLRTAEPSCTLLVFDRGPHCPLPLGDEKE